MKKVDQTVFGEGRGNCFAACVASILELPLEDVPNFCAQPGDWWAFFAEWLANRNLFAIVVDQPTGIHSQLHCIACGDYEGPTGSGKHCVVAHHGKLVHNPNPHQEGRDLARVELAIFLVRAP